MQDEPPADLLVCPESAKPLPTDQAATIPPALRTGLIDFAESYRQVFDQVSRLVEWHRPGSCPPRGAPVR